MTSEKFSVTFPAPEAAFIAREVKATGLSKAAVVVRCVGLEVERRRERAAAASAAIQASAEKLSSARFALAEAEGVKRQAERRCVEVLGGDNFKAWKDDVAIDIPVTIAEIAQRRLDAFCEAALEAMTAADIVSAAEASLQAVIHSVAGSLHAEP